MMASVLALSWAVAFAAAADPTTTGACTAYTKPQECTQGKDWCYNTATCACELSRSQVNCLVNPCDTNKCEDGYQCEASYCGGCGHVCLPKPDACATVRCAANTHCVAGKCVEIPTKPKVVGCSDMACIATMKCVEDKEGNGKCVEIPTKPKVVGCSDMACIATMKCVEDKRGKGKCVAPDTPQRPACIDALRSKTLGDKKRAACCRSFKIGCKNDVDCFKSDAFSPSVSARCCRDQDAGCPATCTADSCCQLKGVCTDAELKAELEAVPTLYAKVSTDARDMSVVVTGDEEEAARNPKELLARARRTILKGSAILQQKPELLVVKSLGLLRGKWSVTIPRTWNQELLDEEKDLVFDEDAAVFADADAARSAQALQQQPEANMYFNFEVLASAAADQVETAVQTGALSSADGSAQTQPVAKDGLIVAMPNRVPTDEGSDGDASALPFAIGGILGALCLGGLFAFTVHRRRQARQAELQFVQVALQDCEEDATALYKM